MQMKIKEKMIAVVMAFAMMFTFIFAGESSEVIAAAKTKALEINVDFARNAASGDDSGIYVKNLISNKKITFGKTYVFQTKIYVPAVYMKTGRIWVKPTVNFFTGKNGDTYAGMAQSSKEGYSYDKNSKEVKKYGDYIDAFMDLENGRIDAVVTDELIGTYYMQKHADSFKETDIVVGEPTDFGIAFAKDNQALRDEVQKVMNEMKADGTIAKISEKWFGKDITTK